MRNAWLLSQNEETKTWSVFGAPQLGQAGDFMVGGFESREAAADWLRDFLVECRLAELRANTEALLAAAASTGRAS